MSESDSDLDFESADEDAEFACNTKSKVCQKSISNDAPSESLSTDVDLLPAASIKISTGDEETSSKLDECSEKSPKQHLSSDLKEDSVKLQTTDQVQDSKASKTENSSSEVAVAGSEFKSHQQFDSPKPISHQEVNPQATELRTNESNPPKEGVGSRLEKKKESSVESEKPPDSASATSSLREESKPPRERVVLRLEKKKQLAKESPVESEKPSDFVNILQDPEEKRPTMSWGFGSWGSSLLSSAASSVSTFSNQVSQGIGSVIETVENTLGAPPPEELAQTLNERKSEAKDATNTEEEKVGEERSGLLPGVSIWTKVLENTGSKVIMGGLDTLELIGKKTMDILTEGDPGLRKKRAAFSGAESLSELLREIKERADEQSKDNSDDDSENLHYSQIFDEKQGLVHLEALEMLSKQSQAKFQRLFMRHSKHSEVKKRLEEIKSICENIPSLDEPSDCENFEDFEAVFKKYTLELSFPLNVDNIIKTQRQISETICNYEAEAEDTYSPPKVIFQSAICSLADFTAKCIETFHKAAELLLVQPNLDPDLEQCATNLTGLTTVMCIEVNNLSSRYHKCLEATAECLQKKSISENTDVKTLATNVYVEASNSNNYIQDAYQMLVPVLQVRFLETID